MFAALKESHLLPIFSKSGNEFVTNKSWFVWQVASTYNMIKPLYIIFLIFPEKQSQMYLT
jgi:hypothetical protein